MGIDDSEPSGACGHLNVSCALNVTGTGLNIETSSTPSGYAYVIASYGSLTGSFASTNGLMPNYTLEMNFESRNQIAIVGPPRGSVFRFR